ncbi:MAG: hypothetical protein U0797_30000 [Gemmataceae bacterium]
MRLPAGGRGTPCWLPAEMVYLNLAPGQAHRIAPGPLHRAGVRPDQRPDPAPRPARVIEPTPPSTPGGATIRSKSTRSTTSSTGCTSTRPGEVARPNLGYRAYRVVDPFSDHVMLVTLSGEDREGWCFSVGTACRETARARLRKSPALEAIHGRFYVRHLKPRTAAGWPTTFAEHATWYSASTQTSWPPPSWGGSIPTAAIRSRRARRRRAG